VAESNAPVAPGATHLQGGLRRSKSGERRHHTRLLHKRLDAVWEAEVDDSGDIRLVQPHPESYRGGDDTHLVSQKQRLCAPPLFRLLARMVAEGQDAICEQELRQPVRLALVGAVGYDALGAAKAAAGAQQLEEGAVSVARLARDGEPQVLAHARIAQHIAVRDAQHRGDGRLGAPRGSGGKRQHLRDAQLLTQQVAKAIVRRPEVVRPLGDAVALVDAGKRKARLRRQLLRERDKAAAEEPLWGNEEHLEPASAQRIERGCRLVRRLHAVKHSAWQRGRQVAQLVLHQRDQRRHNQRHAGKQERSELMAQG